MNHTSTEADFVIVGGGSAGCVLATRLSEDPTVKVVLIEAGSRDSSIYLHLPVTYYKTTGPAFTWGFQTAPQEHQGGMVTPFTQPRVLGGGSSVNAQVYMRGIPRDYDDWRDVYGCHGWGFSDVLPVFKDAENNDRLSEPMHGTDGPLQVSDQAYTHPLTRAWIKACQQAGMPYNSDFNSGDPAGCGLYQVTNRAGKRSSTANAYLHPVENRANLKVFTDAHVTRVLFEGRRAIGVEVRQGGTLSRIKATRETIITSGAIGTPHLLQKSGIGPAGWLKDAGVEVLYDAPEAGANLQDHLDVFLIHELNGPNSYDKFKKPHWMAWAGLQFAAFRSGPVTSNVVEGGAFWWVDRDDPYPDVQFHFLAGAGVEAGIPEVPTGNGCTLNAYLVRPKSRGTVKVSGKADSGPIIDPNYLSAPEDLQKTVDAVKLGRKIMEQSALSGFLSREHFPGSKTSTDAELEDFVRAQARTGYHPAGTCRMGSDERSVVDTELRVRGVDGLRIADNSIMPRLVSANTNATAIMIAERAARFIRGNH
ncbi:alanine-phosphoribitol ligase [Devosia sp. L53-10-65]|uniref:Alanine-phosphoribitol ligase n=1 Tax=Devosia marina TaxID=2683198 RepID=A0A7X3FR71_9HYPH|nr:GMC family oxidoreductase N-terminal domain-containing protein [Devosia marina]MVS98370.1 alanine-phosphoribitol ligase [Devosia marina]